MVCSCVLPLLSSLTKHMTVNDDDPGYIARLKEASVNDFNERVARIKSIAVLKITTVLDPRYKNSKCLSDDAKEQTWSLIEQQIASDDWLKTYVQDDTNNVNSTICEPNEKRFKLMEADFDSEEDVESASDEVQRYKMEKKSLHQWIHYNGGNVMNIDIRNWHSLPGVYFAYRLPQFRVNDYLVLLVILLTRRVHHLNQILLICLFVCVAGYLTIFERKNAYFISGY